jgi:CDP-paratose 2-epimerase
MGRVDQGVFTYWMLAHVLGRELSYIGYGGTGKQVRDLVHVDDVVDLVELQLADPEAWRGRTVNAGGGAERSLSLRETTDLCLEITGKRVPIAAEPLQRPGDVPIYVSDTTRLEGLSDWRPRRPARQVLEDTFEWIRQHESAVRHAL